MKRILLTTACLFVAGSAFAMEVANPFYIPEKGHFLSNTSGTYSDYKTKNGGEITNRTTALAEEIYYGIAPRTAIVGQIGNAWKRATENSQTAREDRNNFWHIGELWDFVKTDRAFVQSKIVYLQRDLEDNHGIYRALNIAAKTGYKFDIGTPYAGAEFEWPIAADHRGNNRPTYRANVGFYQYFPIGASVDVAARFAFQEMDSQKDWALTLKAYYHFTEKIALGLFADDMLDSRSSGHTTYVGKTIGAELKVAF